MSEGAPRSKSLVAVRCGLPAAVVVVAVVVRIVDRTIDGLEGFAMLVGAAAARLLLNVRYRVGVSGDVERDREAEAREHFADTTTGRRDLTRVARLPNGVPAGRPACCPRFAFAV